MTDPGQLVDRLLPSAEGRPDWQDVMRRRTRQQRKRFITEAALALVVMAFIAVPAAWAIGLFHGTPAPRPVKRTLFHANDNQLAAVLGLMKQQSKVDADQTHGVIELRTPQGPLRLWAAPVRGGGHCSYVQVGEASTSRDLVGITNCEPSAPPPTAPAIEGTVDPTDGFRMPGVRVLHGWVRSELLPESPARLTLLYQDGTQAELPLVEDYFLAVVPPDKRAESLTVRGADSQELGTISVGEVPPLGVTTTPVPDQQGPALIERRLSNGAIARLYVRPQGGNCYDVEISYSGTGGTQSSGTCGGTLNRVTVGITGLGDPRRPSGALLDAYLEPSVDRLELQLAGGRSVSVPFTKGYVLFELPKGPRALVAYDSSGRQIERQPILP